MIVDRRELRDEIAAPARAAAEAARRRDRLSRGGARCACGDALRREPLSARRLAARTRALHPKAIDLGLDRVRAVARPARTARSTCPIIVVGGTNGKGSTCAMLESIAARAPAIASGSTPRRTWCATTSACASTARASADDALIAALRGGRGRARRRRADLLRVHARSRSLRLFARAQLDVVDPRGRARRPARRGQRRRRRLSRSSPAIDLDHMDYLGRDARGRSAARRRASSAPAGRRSAATRCRRQSLLDARARDRRRPVAASAATSAMPGDRQQWSTGPGGARFSGLPYPALRGANQLLNAVRRAGRARGAARAPAGQRAGGAQRAARRSSCRARSRCCRASRRSCSTSRTTRTPRARSRRTSTRWASFRARIAVFGDARDKDIAGVIAQLAPRIDRWYRRRPAGGPRGAAADAIAAALRDAAAARGYADPISAHDSIGAALRRGARARRRR